MPTSEFVLETRNLSKNFRGIQAVSGLNLRVQREHIHALIGPNGAGKTTVFNLLTGFFPSSSGSIHLNGVDITRKKPTELARGGLVRSFQISAIFADFTALENVRIALQRKSGLSFHFWKSDRALASLNERAMALLEQVGLKPFHDIRAGELAYGRKRVLEIATTLATEPQVMLLDEPTQGMGHEDVGRITELIERVSTGRTVIIVEHNLKVVETLADRITVLARGSILSEGTYGEVSKDPQVIEAYMGAGHG